jgi:alanine racemase
MVLTGLGSGGPIEWSADDLGRVFSSIVCEDGVPAQSVGPFQHGKTRGMTATSTIRLDLDALAGNLEAVAALESADGGPLGLERLCAVVKADGYGLGASRIAAAMHRLGIQRFAAYGLDEAIEVAEAAPNSTVLILQPIRALGSGGGLPGLLSRGRLHLTAHQVQQVADLAREAARLGVVLPLHLEVDTGMGRGGCGPEEAMDVLAAIAADPRLRLAGLMTHLPDAVGDPISAIERGRRFERFIEEAGDLVPTDAVRHVAATASLGSASLRFDLVRVGIAWVGYGSQALAGRPDPVPLRPIVSWWSRLVQVRRLAAGRTVGYGCTVTTSRETVAGLVPVGYADGLPPIRGDESHRLIVHGRLGPVAVPVLGRMNMDQCVVDLTDVGPFDDDAAVEVLSSDPDSPASLDRVAARAGVLPYQILCGLSSRIPRLLVAGTGDASGMVPSTVPARSSEIVRRLGHG